MIRKLSDTLRKLTSSPFVLFPIFIITFFIFNKMTEDIISKISAPLLDSFLLGYTKLEAISSLELMGPSGREIYIKLYTHYYDIIAPIGLCIVITSMISKTYPLFTPYIDENGNDLYKKSKSDLFNLLPLCYMICDLSENYCHYKILSLYPSSLIDQFIQFGSILCMAKYLFLFISLFILVVGFIINSFRFIKHVLSNLKSNNNNRNNNTVDKKRK